MKIEKCTIGDYHQILADISDFWGSDRTLNVHHPMYIYEFGDSAYVIKIDERVVAYLFGFISQTSPTGYVHLIGVRNDYQNKGLGSALYNHFIIYAKEKGCTKVKAMTIPANSLSIAFHKKIGMKLLGNKNPNGIEVISDYSGPGQDRVVFEKDI
ncbi:MAG TPA: GNAT family N-acetyltransferase [Chryseolinea sp.]